MPVSSFSTLDSLAVSSNLKQRGFRFYSNDGSSVNNQTPKAAANQPIYIDKNVVTSLRIGVYQDGADATTTWRYLLEFRIGSGAWTVLDTGAPTSVAYAANVWNTHDPTTALLDAANFVAGEGIASTANTAAIALPNGKHTELVFSLRALTAYVNYGDIVQFRVVAMNQSDAWSGATAVSAYLLSAYEQYPTMYISASAGGGYTMPERAAVLEIAQLGVETTPGTPVAATIRLECTDIDPDVRLQISHNRVAGFKANTSSSRGKEMGVQRLTGILAYNDLLYLKSSLLAKVTPTTPANNGVWTVNAGSSTFTLTYGGQTTTSLANNVSAAAAQSALEALSSIGVGNVIVTGTGPSLVVKFVGALATGGALTITGTGASVTTTAATATRRWTFFVNPFSADVLQTLTLEKGMVGVANFGQQYAYMIMQAMSSRFTKSEASFTGMAMSKPPTDPFTMTTAGVGYLAARPVDPATVSVWMGAALVGTNCIKRLTRAVEASYDISGRVREIVTLDDSVAGMSAHVEAVPSVKLDVTAQLDTVGQAALASCRATTKQFVLIEAIGDDIEGSGNTAYPFRFRMTMPVKFDTPDRVVVDDTQCVKFSGEAEHDDVFGGFLKVEIDTNVAAL